MGRSGMKEAEEGAREKTPEGFWPGGRELHRAGAYIPLTFWGPPQPPCTPKVVLGVRLGTTDRGM